MSSETNSHRVDAYRVLGLTPAATPTQIAHAFRRLLRDYHPDTRGPARDGDTHSDDRLSALLAAYAVLRDPTHRATHDQHHLESPTATTIPVTHVTNRRTDVTPGAHPIEEPQLWIGPLRRHF